MSEEIDCTEEEMMMFAALQVMWPFELWQYLPLTIQHYPKQPLKAVIIDTYLKVFRVILGEYTHGK